MTKRLPETGLDLSRAVISVRKAMQGEPLDVKAGDPVKVVNRATGEVVWLGVVKRVQTRTGGI